MSRLNPLVWVREIREELDRFRVWLGKLEERAGKLEEKAWGNIEGNEPALRTPKISKKDNKNGN